MVKGISRQVIVLHSPDPKLFDEAIFILKEGALRNGGLSDDVLMQEARRLISTPQKKKRRFSGFWWSACGGLLVGMVWLITALL